MHLLYISMGPSAASIAIAACNKTNRASHLP